MENSEIFNLNWNGKLNLSNLDKVSDLLLQLLDGKKFTIVTVEENSSRHYPHIETKQELSDKTGKKISPYIYEKVAGIQISDCAEIGFYTADKYPKPTVIFYGDYVTITYTDTAGNIYYRSYIPEG